MASTYFMSSVNGFVSSKRRLQRAAELPGDAEVQADGLHVPDVREAVRLRRKPRRDGTPEAVGRDIVRDHVSNEVLSGGGRSGI